MQTLAVTVDKSVEQGLAGVGVTHADLARYRLVEPGAVITDAATGRVLLVFGRLGGDYSSLKRLLPTLPFMSYKRPKMKHQRSDSDYDQAKHSQVQFGFKPRRAMLNIPASACMFNAANPTAYRQLVAFGSECMGLYKHWSPEFYNRQTELMGKVLPCWFLPGTFFTQGSINDTAAISYHYDRGNVAGCWSAMGVFRRDVRGGQLLAPALGIALNIQDETFVLFDGQSLLHGVAPIEAVGPYARRFSVVYYAHAAMQTCGTYEEEAEKLRDSDIRKHRRNKTRAP